MATTITTDNVKTIYALDAVTSLADADDLIVWDSTNSAHKKITRANLQTDIASRSKANLDTLAAITTAGTVLPDGKAVGELYKMLTNLISYKISNRTVVTNCNAWANQSTPVLFFFISAQAGGGSTDMFLAYGYVKKTYSSGYGTSLAVTYILDEGNFGSNYNTFSVSGNNIAITNTWSSGSAYLTLLGS